MQFGKTFDDDESLNHGEQRGRGKFQRIQGLYLSDFRGSKSILQLNCQVQTCNEQHFPSLDDQYSVKNLCELTGQLGLPSPVFGKNEQRAKATSQKDKI